jgi:hypothetical protein
MAERFDVIGCALHGITAGRLARPRRHARRSGRACDFSAGHVLDAYFPGARNGVPRPPGRRRADRRYRHVLHGPHRRSSGSPRIHRPHCSRPGSTPSSSPAHSSLASARASNRSVFALAWRIPVSLGETTITRATCGSRIRAIATHCPSPPARPRHADRNSARNNLSASGRVAIRPAERSRPSSTIATSQNLAVHIQRYRSHLCLLTVERRNGEPVGKRHRRICARSATGQVAGAATEKPGLKRPSSKRPAQPAFSRRP